MTLFLQQLVNGIGNGVVYGAVALALVLIYRTTGVLNFAQGEMALFTTYLAWKFARSVPVAAAIALAFVIGFVGGAIIERVLIRPVEEARSPLNVVIVTLGLFLGINALPQLIFGTDSQQMPKPWPSDAAPGDVVGTTRAVKVGAVSVSWAVIALALMMVAVCALLWLLFQKTRLGLALRAVASNPESSRLVGINAGLTLMLGWALSAGLGAIVGPLVAARSTGFDASLMQGVLVFAFSAAALGGFDSVLGAVVGGLVVGIAEALTTQYVDPLNGIEVLLPLLLILGVLLIRPNGLFGRRTVERV
ncbi:MAG: branched-chain amino acid ABC transporter permease [Actinobacteria bacterium]|nr:branched-chain amino acid ABC transporter permease [Actinomycetota bacterium]